LPEQFGYPSDDGWGWLYQFYDRWIAPHAWLRRPLCAYLNPNPIERAGHGKIYRLLGVQHFGKAIPTGGILIRRLTGLRMAPYTLAGTSLRAARHFRYRTCVFEMAHMPFLLTLLALSIYRWAQGDYRLALEDSLVNLLVNFYPILHHRYTRLRIDSLLAKADNRAGRGCSSQLLSSNA
jgi:hypothetical protein